MLNRPFYSQCLQGLLGFQEFYFFEILYYSHVVCQVIFLQSNKTFWLGQNSTLGDFSKSKSLKNPQCELS